ncbi:hypothetical protein [Nonomuraea sp. NPDC050202]|uniref:hypothetical protein n=1 Tax=Nonomuraea sp. NPDC050202 TaxID=3155035 RepID=UPI00340E171F
MSYATVKSWLPRGAEEQWRTSLAQTCVPFALGDIRADSGLKGKRFAVIADPGVNSKKQFIESQDFQSAVTEAVADNQTAHNTMADYFFSDGPAIKGDHRGARRRVLRARDRQGIGRPWLLMGVRTLHYESSGEPRSQAGAAGQPCDAVQDDIRLCKAALLYFPAVQQTTATRVSDGKPTRSAGPPGPSTGSGAAA